MPRRFLGTVLFAGVLLSSRPAPAAQNQETAVVEASSQVLAEIMSIPARGIPQAMLDGAQGIAIVPGLLKGGFIVGIRHGRGVVLVRDDSGQAWKPPMFIEVTGASLGWQIGIQGTDLILVFRTKRGLENLMRGKITLGAGISAAAGPVGREASAATDGTLRAEIYSYSRSRGLFAGVAVDGSSLSVDTAATNVYYQPGNPGRDPSDVFAPGQLPPSALRLLEQVARYTYTAPPLAAAPFSPGSGVAAVPVLPSPALPPSPSRPVPAAGGAALRQQLADASSRLAAIVDDNWKRYLALPAEVYSGARPPDPALLRQVVGRFDTVAGDPRYHELTHAPSFKPRGNCCGNTRPPNRQSPRGPSCCPRRHASRGAVPPAPFPRPASRTPAGLRRAPAGGGSAGQGGNRRRAGAAQGCSRPLGLRPRRVPPCSSRPPRPPPARPAPPGSRSHWTMCRAICGARSRSLRYSGYSRSSASDSPASLAARWSTKISSVFNRFTSVKYFTLSTYFFNH